MENENITKHGLNANEIHFTPKCAEEIKKHDFIGHDSLKRELYCVREGVFTIVTDDPTNDYLTDDDLKLNFKRI